MLLLQNALLVDGTGSAPVHGNVLIADGRIAATGPVPPQPGSACEVVDCTGMAVSPGFIDIHSHSDLQVLRNDRAKADQGVTTEVVGNCGFSSFPCEAGCHDSKANLHQFANGILFGWDEDWGWSSAGGYLQQVASRARLASVWSLTGHGSLRVACMGQRQSAPEPKELDAMAGTLAECLEEGACGFSTGLMYAPGSSADRNELVRLCKVTAEHGGVYATHMRSYSHDLLSSIEEQLDLARASGVRLQISHLQAVGRANWDKQRRALGMLEQARVEGIDVEFDSYPYLAGSTVLTQLLPQHALDGGTEALLARLSDSGQRRAIAEQTVREMAQRWQDIFIASVASAGNQPLVGRSIADIAEERNCEGIDAAIDLLLEERALVNILSFNQSEANLRALLTHPLCTVISDGFYVKGRPHPRLHGTFPSLFGDIVRERKWLSLEEAVHKVTGKPASRFGMTGRGVLRPGAIADIVVFDPLTVESRATYESPQLPPAGIRLTLREGKVITPCT